MLAHDRLHEIIQTQYEQQRQIMGEPPLDLEERRRLAEKLALLTLSEVHDYLEAIAFKKEFAGPGELGRSSRIVEVVDIVKYALSLAWLDNVTPDEFVEAFRAKTFAVRMRHIADKSDAKVCGIDIDGVLANLYVDGFPRNSDGSDELTASHNAFFDEGHALHVEPIRDAVWFTQWLRQMGWTIVLITARKRHRFKALEGETHVWLHNHGFAYDRILWGADKAEAIANSRLQFAFHVEDSLKHAIDVANSGITVYWYHPEEQKESPHKNIIPVRGFNEILLSEFGADAVWEWDSARAS